MGTAGYQTYPGDQFIVYINIKSACCTLATNIILYINYTSIKSNNKGICIPIFKCSDLTVLKDQKAHKFPKYPLEGIPYPVRTDGSFFASKKS